MSEQNNIPDAAPRAHAAAVDAIRQSGDELLGSKLSKRQQQLVVDLMNAAQDLNTAYWESLSEHQIVTGVEPRCTCGWVGQVFGNDFHEDFISHQADMPRSALRPAP